MDSLFVMNINIGWHLPDAWVREGGGRKEGGGLHDWNSSEPSGSNLDRGTQERANGFRLLLFALRFVWNETFSPHVSHTLSLYLSQWISQRWPTAYRSSSLHDISTGRYLIPPHKHKTSVLLTLIKLTDHLSEKLYIHESREGAERNLLALKLPGSPPLTQHR